MSNHDINNTCIYSVYSNLILLIINLILNIYKSCFIKMLIYCNLGMLIDQLNELGREEVALIVLQHTQCYKIKIIDINNCSIMVNQL